MAKRKSRSFKKSDAFTAVVVIIVLLIALLWYYYNKEEEKNKITGIDEIFSVERVDFVVSGELKIHFIDVGQGDAIFIEFPDGKNMLVDAGDNGKEEEVIGYLNDLGIDVITVLLLTHADADHSGGMEEVFENFEIEYCLRPSVYYNGENKSKFEDVFNQPSGAEVSENCNTKTYYGFLDALLEENCGYEYFNKDTDFAQKVAVNGVEYIYSLDFLTPTDPIGKIGYRDANDYSPIINLTYGVEGGEQFGILLTGDAEKVAEAELVNSYANLPDVDVLKVGHHGSATSSAKELLEKIKPEFAVISCGKDNKYSHPRQETIDRLIEQNSVIYRTDLQGDILLSVSENGDFEFFTQFFAEMEDLNTGITPMTE